MISCTSSIALLSSWMLRQDEPLVESETDIEKRGLSPCLIRGNSPLCTSSCAVIGFCVFLFWLAGSTRLPVSVPLIFEQCSFLDFDLPMWATWVFRRKQLLVDFALHRLKSSQCMQWTLRRRMSTLQSSPQGFGISAESFGFFRSQDCGRVEHETFCLCLKDFDSTYHALNASFHLVRLAPVLDIVPFACLPAPCRQILQCMTLIRLESWTMKASHSNTVHWCTMDV